MIVVVNNTMEPPINEQEDNRIGELNQNFNSESSNEEKEFDDEKNLRTPVKFSAQEANNLSKFFLKSSSNFYRVFIIKLVCN